MHAAIKLIKENLFERQFNIYSFRLIRGINSVLALEILLLQGCQPPSPIHTSPYHPLVDEQSN
jgi:hypothetical protein